MTALAYTLLAWLAAALLTALLWARLKARTPEPRPRRRLFVAGRIPPARRARPAPAWAWCAYAEGRAVAWYESTEHDTGVRCAGVGEEVVA